MLVFLTASFTNAQISQGDPTATTIKTGNRPDAGTFGLYFGGALLLHGEKPYFMPSINLKYFASKKLEIRASLDVYSNSYSYSGRAIGAGIYDDDKQLYKLSKGGTFGGALSSHFTLAPGFAYHFSNSNILDVYVGAEVPLGIRSYSNTSVASGDNAPGGNATTNITATPFHLGLNALIGLQAFIGNLPLAIGFEYGLGLGADLGYKYKVVSVEGDNKATYYVDGSAMQTVAGVNALDNAATKFANLSSSQAEIDHFFRVTLSYYFK